MLHWLREVYLRLKPSKCKIGASDIVLLGHLVPAAGIWPDPSTVVAVQNFPVPTTPTNMKAFLGFTSYYRNFIRGYTRVAGPLFELVCKDVSFVSSKPWHQLAFEELKKCLVSTPNLVRLNFTKLFIGCRLVHQRSGGCFVSEGWEKGSGCGLCK